MYINFTSPDVYNQIIIFRLQLGFFREAPLMTPNFLFSAPEVFVISSRGERVQDVYYKEGSTLQLICEGKNILYNDKLRSYTKYTNGFRKFVSVRLDIIWSAYLNLFDFAQDKLRQINDN